MLPGNREVHMERGIVVLTGSVLPLVSMERRVYALSSTHYTPLAGGITCSCKSFQLTELGLLPSASVHVSAAENGVYLRCQSNTLLRGHTA